MEDKIKDEFREEFDVEEPFTISKIPFPLGDVLPSPKPDIFPMLRQTLKQSAPFSLSRTSLFLILSGCFAFSFFIALFFLGFSLPAFFLFCSTFFGITVLNYLLKIWEERLRSTVATLVSAKIEQLGAKDPSEKEYFSLSAKLEK